MARRPLQEINAGSMADIAFLLLIFFLVTTTMSTNTGMQRKLPPPPDPKIKNDEAKVKERNVMVVLINKDNNIAIKGKPIQLKDICAKTKLFFTNPNNNKNLPEKKIKDIPFFGKYPVSKGIISLQTDRATNYGKYLKVNNELVRAIDELRDEKAMQKFGMTFDELGKVNKDEQKAVSQIYPLNISEAEPRRITAGAGK